MTNKYELIRVKINKNKVLRWVSKTNPNEWLIVKNGVDDLNSSFKKQIILTPSGEIKRGLSGGLIAPTPQTHNTQLKGGNI